MTDSRQDPCVNTMILLTGEKEDIFVSIPSEKVKNVKDIISHNKCESKLNFTFIDLTYHAVNVWL